MRPSPILCKRLKSRVLGFSTKQVGRGFYRGTGAGSMGAHTPKGGYLIDYRKTKHFVKPYMQDTRLTPFVSAELYHGSKRQEDARGNTFKQSYGGLQYLDWFRHMNEESYNSKLSSESSQQTSASSSASTYQEEPVPEQKTYGSSEQQESTKSSPQAS